MNKRILSLAVALILLLASVTLLAGCGEEKVDYVASVKAWKPFGSSGITATYGTVLNKYISSCKWTATTHSKDLTDVEASGQIKASDGTSENITIKVSVTPGTTKDTLKFKLVWAKFGDETFDGDETSDFIANLFEVYDAGYDSLEQYFAE